LRQNRHFAGTRSFRFDLQSPAAERCSDFVEKKRGIDAEKKELLSAEESRVR